MTRGTVAFRATGLLVFDIAVRGDVADHDRVATDAVVLQLLQVRRANSDRLMEFLQRESLRVVPAVFGLHEVLVGKCRGDVAVIAACDTMMTGFHPRIVLVIHNVAVLASGGIVAEIGETFGEMKGEK